MGRSTVYNKITSEEKLRQINPDNIELGNDFLEYLASTDRSPSTIYNYSSDLKIFWCWNLDKNKNKYFPDLTKRDVAKFQNFALNELGWSSNRLARVKSCLSSLSTFIENILDDEIENYKPIIRKIENPVKIPVRDKTVLSEEQVNYLLQELVNQDKLQQACVVALAAFCGCRKAEITRFKTWYFKSDNLICDGALYKTPEKIKTKGRGAKTGKLLTKYVLAPEFQPYLDLWLEKRKELNIESEWLFVTKENDEWTQIKISTISSYAQLCSKILDINFYFHSLRHQLCTRMVSKYHLPQKIIQEFFGWSSSDMIQIYDDSEASDEFSRYFTADGITVVKETKLSDIK